MTSATADEKFELTCRLIERYDNHLSSLESRTATVISADALLLAGTTFLVDKVLSQSHQYSFLKQLFIDVSIGLAFVTLALSIAYAASGIANVWKTTRELAGGSPPQKSLFFRASNTVKALKGFSCFEDNFNSTSKEQMLSYALNELWLITNLDVRRQRLFQRAVRLLLFSVVPFLVAYAMLTIR